MNPEDLMPLDVDDELIFEHNVLATSNNESCLVTGFIIHSRVFWAAIRDPVPNPTGGHCPCVRAKDSSIEIIHFNERLNCLRDLATRIPSGFQLWEPAHEQANEDALDDGEKIAKSQFASIRANLHVTLIWLQSLILDQLEAAQSHCQHGSPATESPTIMDQRLIWVEREKLCRQLFFILFNFPRLGIETNGLHLANKVRDVVASLIGCPFHPDDPLSKQASEYIQLSTDVLSRLDSSEGINTMHLQTWVDTDRVHR